VRRVFRFAMEPDMNWAFRKDATDVAPVRARTTAPREKVDA
jgi:hypothetical protein